MSTTDFFDGILNIISVCNLVTKLMDNLRQDAQSGQNLEGRLKECGFEHISTETTFIDCGKSVKLPVKA